MPRYRVVDSDGHVLEPESMWPRYLEERFHGMAPRLIADSQGRLRTLLEGRMQPYIPRPPDPGSPSRRRKGGSDPLARLEDMDDEGMDASVMFPTAGLHFAAVQDPEVASALCRAYNDWLYDFAKTDPKRLITVAVVPQADVYAAMNETRRAVGELGAKGVMWRPNPVGGRNLHEPYFDPMWSLLEELGVPLCLHEGTTQNVPQSGLDRYDNFLFRHVVSHPHEQQMGVLNLICGGVLERHPNLRVASLESGCGWIAHWLERINHHLEYWGHASAPLPMKADEYWDRQCYISADPDEAIIPGIIQAMGDDTIIFASDYPHPDGIFPGVVKELADRADLSETSKAKILGENAVRCYGLERDGGA